VHDGGFRTRLAFEALGLEQLDCRTVGGVIAAVFEDQRQVPLEAFERGDDPALVGQMVDGAIDLLGAGQDARERILQAVGQPVHHFRDF
jgi:hypothetical protein